MICQRRLALTATHKANVAEVAATIRFERFDFRFIARGHHLVPVQPELPAIGHGVGEFDLHDAGPFPMPSPPGRRMQTPEVLGPPFAQVAGN